MRQCTILLQSQLLSDAERNIYQHWQLNFQETEAALFTYKRPDDLASNNTEPNVNQRNSSENGISLMREDYSVIRRVDSVY
jgi:hypothetical protein